MKKKPLTNKAGQVRELTQKDISEMRSAKEVLPITLLLGGFPRAFQKSTKYKLPALR